MPPFSNTLFKTTPIIGILRNITPHHIAQILPRFIHEGFTTLEITMNTPQATSIISEAIQRYGNQLNIGAGTVLTKEHLQHAVEAGAQFIVTPIVEASVITTCVARQIPIFAGAYTPTEIYTAWTLGATAVKIFPAEIGGLAYIKALKAPFNDIPLLPTGGVDAENLSDFFKLGIFGVGMGSSLFPKNLIEQEDWAGLSKHLKYIKQKLIEAILISDISQSIF